MRVVHGFYVDERMGVVLLLLKMEERSSGRCWKWKGGERVFGEVVLAGGRRAEARGVPVHQVLSSRIADLTASQVHGEDSNIHVSLTAGCHVGTSSSG